MKGDVMDSVLIIQTFVKVNELMYIEFTDFSQAGTTRTTAFWMIETEGLRITYEWFAYSRKE